MAHVRPRVPKQTNCGHVLPHSRTLVLPEDMKTMLFHANYVSISVAGDYYQAMFAEEDTDDDSDRAYLIIQRQFEDLEDDTCYIETHDRKYSGHFLLRRIEFTPERLSIEFDRPNDNLISVTFAWRRRSLNGVAHRKRRYVPLADIPPATKTA